MHRSHSDRLLYALSPRFAPSCSEQMLEGLGELLRKDNSLYVQTHYAENIAELKWVQDLFPWSDDYLEVYEKYKLVGEKTILAHGIHSSDSERQRLLDAKVTISHCPSSNLYLGSGLFELSEHIASKQKITLGSDVGAGTGFSIWSTLSDAVKISKIKGDQVDPRTLFYLATAGAAAALSLGDKTGYLKPGADADIQVINPELKPELRDRLSQCVNSEQILSALIFLADDRNLVKCYSQGRSVL